MRNKFIYLLLICLVILSCKKKKQGEEETSIDLPQIEAKKELNVLTLYSSTSYFLYKGQEMGYEYELIERFARSKGLKLNIIVAENVSKLEEMLLNGKGDVIAYQMPITQTSKKKFRHCGQEVITHQVLIQPEKKDSNYISNVTELVGKEVYVESGSKYEERLKNLDKELGGGIHIHQINKDTLVTEDLIEMVSEGKIPYTLADNNIARLNKTYYGNIDIHLEVSFPQRSSWAVRKDSPLLAKAINDWFIKNSKTADYKNIGRRYFELTKNPVYTEQNVKKGSLSPYDSLFKEHAKKINWDWRLIAAQAFKESRFDNDAVSWAGARGIMQLMPNTARRVGVRVNELTDPDRNIYAAVRIIGSLNKSFSKITDREERIKFILAAYNSGIGHILDAMALAEKYGKNPLVWDHNVSEFILLKSNPEYFNDEVCKFGYFRGRETFNYVKEVLSRYEVYKKRIK